MSVLQLLVGVVLPPVSAALLLVGLAIRVRVWYRAPLGKITLYPAAKSSSQLWAGVAKEVFLFRSLWGGDPSLWATAWVFHISLALIFVGHLRVVTDFPRLWAALGLGAEGVDVMSAWIGGAVGVLVLGMGLFLLGRRFTSKAARDASKVEDYLALLLLLGVIVTGDALRFLSHFDLEQTRAYFRGLLTLNVQSVPESPIFLVHFLLGQVLLMYLPAGKLLHLPGVLFSHPLLRWE